MTDMYKKWKPIIDSFDGGFDSIDNLKKIYYKRDSNTIKANLLENLSKELLKYQSDYRYERPMNAFIIDNTLTIGMRILYDIKPKSYGTWWHVSESTFINTITLENIIKAIDSYDLDFTQVHSHYYLNLAVAEISEIFIKMVIKMDKNT